ncbi:MAG: DUF5615 family PIN-like protein [Planctomycetes bacterium]|nr:DUF5615 family PIN-like protein [Planctomycetota bacterium]
MARFYANENFPLPVVERLRQLGHDVLTSEESGRAGRRVPDEEVLAFATAQRRAILTLNRKHFIQLHLGMPGHEGIVACTFDPDFEGQSGRIDEAIRALPDLHGRLVRVNRPIR